MRRLSGIGLDPRILDWADEVYKENEPYRRENKGGTGQKEYTAGDMLYASGTHTLSKLAKGTTNQVLTMNAGATAPEWRTHPDAGWELVFDYTVSGSAVTSVATGSILDGNTDELYMIAIYHVSNTASALNIHVVPNNNTTATNYFYQQMNGGGASVTASNATNYSSGLYAQYNQVSGGPAQAIGYLWAKTGRARTFLCQAWSALTSNTMQVNMRNSGWKDTSTNITSITFTSSVATSIDVGSRFVIWKKGT